MAGVVTPGGARDDGRRWRRAGGQALDSDWLATTDWLRLGLYTKRVKGVCQEKTQSGRLRSDINWYDWLRQEGAARDQGGSRWRQQPGAPRRSRLTGGGGGPVAGGGPAAGAGAAGGQGPGGSAGFAPADVMAIRRMLEPSAMRLVVAWATAADFGEMDRCLAGGEQADGYDEFELWDLALHRGIMAASRSPLLARLYAVIEEARHGQFWGDLKRRSASRERQSLYQADHRELVAALRARDADRAVEAMRTHLARVSSHLFDEAS